MPPIIRSDSKTPWSPERKDNAKSLGLAVLAHILLIIVLFFGLNWHTQNPGPVQVELWMDGDTPDAAPPKPTPEPEPPKPQPEPPKPQAEPPKPEPEPKPEPPPPPTPPQAQPEPQPDPEIALEAARKKREQEEKARQAAEAAKEKARLEEERRQAELKEKQRLEQERKAAEQKAKDAAEKKAKEDAAKKAAADKAAAEKAAADKAAAEKAAAEKAAAEQKAKEDAAKKAAAEKKAKEDAAKKAAADKALRDAFRNDILGTAGRPGGTADRNQAGGGRDDGYGAKVRACVQPKVAFPTPPRAGSANPTAEYRVQLGRDGKVGNVTLTRSSGNAGFDRAVENGIRSCNPFPPPSKGSYEPLIDVVYRMYD